MFSVKAVASRLQYHACPEALGVHDGTCAKWVCPYAPQEKKIVSPVFAAHMLSLKLPFELRSDYGGHPLPAGEQPLAVLYEHCTFYVDKMRRDLKNIGAWDRSLQHVACRFK